MKKLRLLPIAALLLLSSCMKNNAKSMEKDLCKVGKWNIESIHIVEYDNPGTWAGQEVVILDTTLDNAGYMEFLEDEGDVHSTYKKGKFKPNGASEMEMEWYVYGTPGVDDTPSLEFIFYGTWNEFINEMEYSSRVDVWEKDEFELHFEFGQINGGSSRAIYTVRLKS